MFDFLKKKELETISILESTIIDLENTLITNKRVNQENIQSMMAENKRLKDIIYSLTDVKCRNDKCLDYENGKCSLSKITIKHNGRCEEFGEDDIDMMEEFTNNVSSTNVAVVAIMAEKDA